MKEIPKAYIPAEYEDKIYAEWERSGFFNSDNLKGEPYSIMMPPPNVTGVLHLGHALENALMDTMARYRRLRGKKVLLLPGTDHAAVATQAKVEKLLMEKGIKNPRQELGREGLLKEIREFAEKSKATILSQIKKMGTSCDWSRLAYTFDEPRSAAVNEIFKRMYDDGLIYRGFRAVNWSVKGQSTLSDDEIVYVERKAKFYTFKYGKSFPFTIATTRPETKLGDTAVAVNPKDPRYKKYIGKEFKVDFVGQPLTLKIIADRGVDMKFGTGALGVTPAHSLVDYEMGVKNELPIIKVISEDGKMTNEAGKFAGLAVAAAREGIVEELKKRGLLVKEEEISQNVGTSDRFGDVVEVLPMTQWFVAVNKKISGRGQTLKELMKKAVGPKGVKITPARFQKIYFSWIENLRDWCISRQIYWGHRIPVWYKSKVKSQKSKVNEEIFVGEKPPEGDWVQDADTLDTWFSSGLWTFSTLGWPVAKVIFVRHGEARGNADNILDDKDDTEWNVLTKKGEKQILKTASEIKRYGAEKIIASPILRTKETAEILAKELGLGIEFDDRVREIGVGKLQGGDCETFTKARREFYSGGANKYGIEPLKELEKRTRAFLKDLNEKYAGKTVIVVSHGDPIAYMAGTVEFAKKQLPGKYTPVGGHIIRDIDNMGDANIDLKEFHPTDWMQMGHEILFFWMARMILMSEYALKEIPFRDVYIHGILRDAKGQKFSKSLGNAVDPLEMTAKYGTDALRLSLLSGVSPGQDQRFYEDKVEGARNLVNKLWNISRYIVTASSKLQIPNSKQIQNSKFQTAPADEWILGKFNNLVSEVTRHLEKYNFSQAAEKLREFTWCDFADWYLEVSKIKSPLTPLFKRGEPNKPLPLEKGGREGFSRLNLLLEILEKLLILWHPFLPFVTEVIWNEMLGKKNLIVAEWPLLRSSGATKGRPSSSRHSRAGGNLMDFEKIRDVITKIRNLRAENKIEPGKIMNIYIRSKYCTLFEDNEIIIAGLTKSRVQFTKSDSSVSEIRMVVDKLDKEKNKIRFEKDLMEKKKYAEGLKNKLENKEFVVRAPKAVVDAEKEKLQKAEDEIKNLKEQLRNLY